MTAAVVSFGGGRVVTWKSVVRLSCLAMGQPQPAREWFLGDTALVPAPPRLVLAADGALTITSAQRNDQGEYKCVVWNKFGRDHIVYQLIVQGKPPKCIFIQKYQGSNCPTPNFVFSVESFKLI